MLGKLGSYQLLPSSPRTQSKGCKRRGYTHVSIEDMQRNLVRLKQPASCDYGPLCKLRSTFERVATKSKIHVLGRLPDRTD